MLHTHRELSRINMVTKPVGDGCNINCKYCYVDAEPKKLNRMNSQTMEKLHETAIDFIDRVEIVWHGGEPLLAGHDFFREVAKVQQKLTRKDKGFKNIIQSNFTLMDEEFAQIFSEQDYLIGTSLDGLKDIHDEVRTHFDGGGTWDQVMNGIDIVKQVGGNFGGVIACCTSYMLGREAEVYDFMRSNNFNWSLSAFIKSGRAIESEKVLGITPEEYAITLNNIFDMYFFDNDATNEMATIDTMLRNLFIAAKRERELPDQRFTCQEAYMGIDWEGNVYPCARFTQMPEFIIGNVNEEPLSEILNNPLRQRLQCRTYDNTDDCIECKYKRACDTGCPYNAHVFKENVMSKDYYCDAFKIIWDHMINTINSIKEGGNARV